MFGSGRPRIVRFGDTAAVKIGTPSSFADPYYWVMEMSWPSFILLVCVMFAIINVVFGGIYAALPEAIANAKPGSIADGLFFSIDTLATVGYGYMYPANHLAHAIASLEILLGLFFSATITGLIFARFARPRASLAFSGSAIIGRYEGEPALMVRVASTRSRPLADAAAQMAWLETTHLPGGGTYRQLTELELVRSRNPMFGLAWTLVHRLEEGSRLLAALRGSTPFTLSVTVNGTDTLLASQSVGSSRYTREDVRIDHEFVDVISERDGTLYLDMHLLGETRPLGTNVPDG